MGTLEQWSQTLWNPALALPDGVASHPPGALARRMDVYRNNVMVSLVDALAHTFPVTLELVGEVFFRAMAQVFVRAHPPRTRVLAHYGQALPGFIAHFEPAAHLTYLADVAQLEWLRLQVLHAADTCSETQIDAPAIALLLRDTDRLPQVRWKLVPSVVELRASSAAVSIWAAHQPQSAVDLCTVDVSIPQCALVFRVELDVVVLTVDKGTATLVECLREGATFGEAVAQAHAADAAFDLSQTMALLIQRKLLAGAQVAGGSPLTNPFPGDDDELVAQ